MKKGKKDDEQKEIGQESKKTEGAASAEKKKENAAVKDYDALWDRYLRLQAEFDNFRKRLFRERVEFVKFANEGLILELLEILDNFERGIKSAEQKKDFDLLHQGVDMISRQLHALLEAKGLRRIKCVDTKFDPHQHEALEVIEDAGVEDDKIVEELQPGYMFNGRIIRPAKVKVASKPDHRPQTTDHRPEEKEKKDKENQEEKNTELGEA